MNINIQRSSHKYRLPALQQAYEWLHAPPWKLVEDLHAGDVAHARNTLRVVAAQKVGQVDQLSLVQAWRMKILFVAEESNIKVCNNKGVFLSRKRHLLNIPGQDVFPLGDDLQ